MDHPINSKPSKTFLNPFSATWEAATAHMSGRNVITLSARRNLDFAQQDPSLPPWRPKMHPFYSATERWSFSGPQWGPENDVREARKTSVQSAGVSEENQSNTAKDIPASDLITGEDYPWICSDREPLPIGAYARKFEIHWKWFQKYSDNMFAVSARTRYEYHACECIFVNPVAPILLHPGPDRCQRSSNALWYIAVSRWTKTTANPIKPHSCKSCHG